MTSLRPHALEDPAQTLMTSRPEFPKNMKRPLCSCRGLLDCYFCLLIHSRHVDSSGDLVCLLIHSRHVDSSGGLAADCYFCLLIHSRRVDSSGGLVYLLIHSRRVGSSGGLVCLLVHSRRVDSSGGLAACLSIRGHPAVKPALPGDCKGVDCGVK